MRIKTIELYKFEELSPEAQEKVIQRLWDINLTGVMWYEQMLFDAEEIGLKIKDFDTERGNYCNGEFINTAYDTAKAIIVNHGEGCETCKTAQNFLKEYAAIEKKANEQDMDGSEFWFDDETEEANNEFLKSLCEDYLILLRKEYEYMTSEEAIKETIIINEYEFTKDGGRPC